MILFFWSSFSKAFFFWRWSTWFLTVGSFWYRRVPASRPAEEAGSGLGPASGTVPRSWRRKTCEASFGWVLPWSWTNWGDICTTPKIPKRRCYFHLFSISIFPCQTVRMTPHLLWGRKAPTGREESIILWFLRRHHVGPPAVKLRQRRRQTAAKMGRCWVTGDWRIGGFSMFQYIFHPTNWDDNGKFEDHIFQMANS